MPTQIVGRVVKPPAGWTWKDGKLQPSDAFSETTFDALYAWAKKRSLGLEPDLQAAPFYFQHTYVTCVYKVWKDSWAITEKWLGDGTWTLNKTGGLGPYSLGQAEVRYAGSVYYNSCAHCGRVGLRTESVGAVGSKRRFCAACVTPCASPNCSEWVYTQGIIAGADQDKCNTCVPRGRCRYCSAYHPSRDLTQTVKGNRICGPCKATRTCGKCESVGDQLRNHEGTRVCPKCYGEAIDKDRAKHEKWEREELPISGTIKLESLPNRPVRTISVETEVDGDATALANTLYNTGLVREGFVENYGSVCPDGSHWPAFLKHDGSVTGGELINYLLNLDIDAHADSFLNVLSKLRSLEKLGKVQYNCNCGGHIHIDAHNFSLNNAWRLVTVYNYLEDVIFRLAGSGHKYGHRTLVEGHDRANGGRGYSHPTPKGPWGIESSVHQAIYNQDRMTGLNFKPYFGAVRHCRCGAGVENLRSCKCTLPKCTIEWRVWNSQGNPRILHAWLAFMQALHAWADTPKELTDEEEKAYPPLGWAKKGWKNTSASHKTTALERVRWIFGNLVFSEAERDSLVYAFKQTDIEFPEGFWDEVGEIPTPKNRVVKRPRNCSIRQKEIKVTPPDTPLFGTVSNDERYRRQREYARFAVAGGGRRLQGGRW